MSATNKNVHEPVRGSWTASKQHATLNLKLEKRSTREHTFPPLHLVPEGQGRHRSDADDGAEDAEEEEEARSESSKKSARGDSQFEREPFRECCEPAGNRAGTCAWSSNESGKQTTNRGNDKRRQQR